MSKEDFSAGDLSAVEAATQQWGRRIFEQLQAHRPSMLQPSWWDEQVLELAMRDEAVKVQLFRFVDALPMLQSADAVVGHLREYLGEVESRLPGAALRGLDLVASGGLTARALARAIRLAARRQARRFIAGSSLPEVVAAARRQRELGRAFSLDILGETVASDVEAERFFQAYLGLIRDLPPRVARWSEVGRLDRDSRGTIPRTNISIKLSALDSQADPIDPIAAYRRIAPRLRELLRAARENDVFLNFDMESYRTKELTIHIFKEILGEDEFHDMAHVGIAIQCYLKDVDQDLQRLVEWVRRRGTSVGVRLVKGAYWDYEAAHARATGWPVPVFEEKWQTDASFERQCRFLIRHAQWLRPAVGSHNVRSIACAIAAAEVLGVPRDDLEFQMLYGMGDPEKFVLCDLDYRVRIYMPYGELVPGMAYLVRRLLENTSNDSFLRATFSEEQPWEQLLVPPERPPAKARPTAENAAPAPKVDVRYWKDFHNQPPLDFSAAENRRNFENALRQVEARLGGSYPLVIGGRPVETRERIVSLDPSQKSRVVGTVASASAAEVELAVRAACDAARTWSAMAVTDRGDCLRRAADLMRGRRYELAAWMVYECGKNWREADADVCEAIDFCRFYAAGAEALCRGDGVRVPGEDNRFVYLPRGVTAVIAPWNFPLAILTGMTAAALATGNTVVMKPAEQSPVVAALLMELLQEAGVPAGAVNYLPGRGEDAGRALVMHPEVMLIAFTGSMAVGLGIQARAAEASSHSRTGIKRVIAEMGGKNAIVVDDDADLDEAVLGIIRSAFGYQGQKCSACSRVIAVRAVYEPLLERLVEAARSLVIGPAWEAAALMGPLIDQSAYDRVRGYIDQGRSEAREVLAVDTGELSGKGYFVGPHIFADVPPDARIAQEEIFGPLLAVMPARDFADAVRLANGTPFGLTGAVYSRSPRNLRTASRELMVGNLYLNRQSTGALVGRQPFGGLKMSGIGSKAGGADYLLQFVQPKTVTENTMRRGFAPEYDGQNV